MPTNINEFVLQLNLAEGKIEEKLVVFHKEVVHLVYKQVVELSPVWSGQFRANNNVSIGSPDSSIEYSSAPRTLWPASPGEVMEARGNSYVDEKLAGLKAFQNVYISNYLDYAGLIEVGHSPQAPIGVYLVAATIAAYSIGSLSEMDVKLS